MANEAQIKAVEDVIYQGKYQALSNHEIAVWACEVYEAAADNKTEEERCGEAKERANTAKGS